MKKFSLFICFVLLINLMCINTSASSITNASVDSAEQIIMPDLGLSLTQISYNDVVKIHKIANQITELSLASEKIEELRISDAEKSELKLACICESSSLKKELQKLGAVKLTEEQALAYVTGANVNSRSSSIPGVNYPSISGIEFYIFEYTFTLSDDPANTVYEMANCIALPSENVNSKMVRIFDPVNLYSKTKISTLANKTIRFSAQEVTDYMLSAATGGTWSFAIRALWNLVGDSLPSTTSSSEARLDLTVSTSSRITHYWRKINGTYYFRLATCAALVNESWLLIDNNGTHKYKHHEFWAYSKYHRDGADERAVTVNSAESYSIYLPYYVSSSNIPKLEVSPFHAAVPTHFATAN